MTKILSFIFFLLLGLNILGQKQEPNLNMRKVQKKKNYGEKTFILKDTLSQIKLYQDIYYNVKSVIDEEFSYTLTFLIYDTVMAKKKRFITHLDTSIAKIKYDLFSVWDLGVDHYTLTGNFEIIELSKHKAIIREDIIVNDIDNKRKLFFNGVKTYVYNADW